MAKSNIFPDTIEFTSLGDPTEEDVENFSILFSLWCCMKTKNSAKVAKVAKSTRLSYLLSTFKERKLLIIPQEIRR